MKNLMYIAMIAGLIFGIQTTDASSTSANEWIEGPSTSPSSGPVHVSFNKERNDLVIEVNSTGAKERVTIQVMNSAGNLVAKEIFIVHNGNGFRTIGLDGERPGIFQVTVTSKSFRYSEKINTK